MSGIAIGGGAGGGFNPQPPESVATGTGGYTIPAGKYGYLQMNVSCVASGSGNSQPFAWQNQTSANSSHQWVVAGDSITVSNSAPSGSVNINSFPVNFIGNYTRATTGYCNIQLNGTNVCSAQAYAFGSGNDGSNTSRQGSCSTSHTNYFGWSVAIFST